MTNRDRRAFLGAIAAAPAILASSPANAASISTSSDLMAIDDLCELLDHAARTNPDRHFADLCAAALLAKTRYEASESLGHDALASAQAATPPFPEGLCYTARHTITRGPNAGQVIERPGEQHHVATGPHDFKLWTFAQWRMKAAGVSYQEAETQLRAEYASWSAARDEARARFLVDEIEAATDAAHRDMGRALQAVADCPATNGAVVITKLRVRVLDDWLPDSVETFAAIVADVAPLLRSMELSAA